MPKFRETSAYKRPIPTPLEGIFLSPHVNKALLDDLQNRTKEVTEDDVDGNIGLLQVIFQNVVVAETGEAFDDLQTVDDIRSLLDESPLMLPRLVNAVAAGLESEVKKSKSPRTSS